MKTRYSRSFCLIVTLISVSTITFAQPKFKAKFKYASIGFNLNAMNYVGDLDPAQNFISPAFKYTRPSVGITLLKRFGPRVSWRANASWGRIKGDDSENSTTSGDDLGRHARNLSFRNNIYELKADIVIDMFENRKDARRRVQSTPYFFTGIVGFYHNPKALYNGSWVALQPLQTEGVSYSRFQAGIPLGIGYRYKLNDQWDLAFEIGWRFPFTDYLDDVSTTYQGDENFEYQSTAYFLQDRSLEAGAYGPTIWGTATFTDSKGNTHQNLPGYGRPGDIRGDANRDWYIVTGFHLTYIFHPRIICPKFR